MGKTPIGIKEINILDVFRIAHSFRDFDILQNCYRYAEIFLKNKSPTACFKKVFLNFFSILNTSNHKKGDAG